MLSRVLTYSNVRAVLPEIEAAEGEFYRQLALVKTDDEYEALVKVFNGVLYKGLTALHEDTKHTNSLSTLEQIYLGRGRFDTHFGINPTVTLKKLMGDDL